ncbi:MAG: phosphatidylglycerophosphatase A [Candidatus Schekmanbacteria bacterium]|nr:phosphatidylglycerophosphatase A [Candidatus Schekmanbacteria bacterium]
MKKLIIFFSTACYLGYSPIVPGTAGSLGGLIIYYFIERFSPEGLSNYSVAASIVFITIAGIFAASYSEKYFGTKDSSEIVIDEVAGMLISLFLIPFKWKYMIAAFVIFRIMDIIKPFPGRRMEKLSGGTGVMLDDVVAGIYSNIIMQILIKVY